MQVRTIAFDDQQTDFGKDGPQAITIVLDDGRMITISTTIYGFEVLSVYGPDADTLLEQVLPPALHFTAEQAERAAAFDAPAGAGDSVEADRG